VGHGSAAVAAVNPAAYSDGGSDAPVSQLIDAPTVASAVIHGKRGGQVGVGAFKVIVPPGAWNGNANVTVKQPNLSQPVVELSITPASKNAFKVPVTLVVNISRVDPARVGILGVSGLDMATGRWTAELGATVDLKTKTMSVRLWHFSHYRVDVGGQPGW